MHFIEKGSGTCVLFLHGWGGNCYSFYQVFEKLSRNFHCVAIDFSGFGQTPEPSKPYTVAMYAQDVAMFLKEKNIQQLHIVAHSFGGRVAAILHTLIPAQILSMVFVDVAGVKPRRGISYYCKVANYKLCKWLVNHHLLSSKVLQRFGSAEYKQLSKVMRQTYIYVVNQNLKTYFQKITCPVLLIWGAKDKDTPMYMAKCLNKWIKHSKLIVFKQASHFSYLQEPIAFESYVDAFLKGKV